MSQQKCVGARIMLVDDEASGVAILERILRHAGFEEILAISDPLQVAESYISFSPDIILLDLNMPNRDGFGVLTDLGHLIDRNEFVPIIVITGDDSPEARQRALSMGAIDFITKPFNRLEVVLRINNLLHTRQLHVFATHENEILEERVRERTAAIEEKSCQLEMAKLEILNRLALAAEFRDDDTGEHTQRVGELSYVIAMNLGFLEEDARKLALAAQLHDIGKIGIPDAILLKPGKLLPEEYEVIKRHTLIGERLLSRSNYDLLNYAAIIARSHHENWDGSGYPHGLAGEDIPLAGRIVSVADVFDALTHKRSYKEAWTKAEALDEIRRMTGIKFDPDVVAGLLSTPVASLAV